MATKTVTTEVDVEVDVDLKEFDDVEITEEFIERLDDGLDIDDFSARKIIGLLSMQIKMKPENEIIPENLDEEIRFDHLCKVFNKYSTAEIEAKLPL